MAVLTALIRRDVPTETYRDILQRPFVQLLWKGIRSQMQ